MQTVRTAFKLLIISAIVFAVAVSSASNLIFAQTLEDSFPFICTTGTVEQMQAAINAGADVNAIVPPGSYTPLMAAALDSNHARASKKIMLLLEAKADPKLPNNDGFTALHIAAGEGNLNVVASLLAAGADVNSTNHIGLTPLMEASLKKRNWPEGLQEQLVQMLLKAGANIKPSTSIPSPLFFAANKSGPDVINMLIAAGCDVNTTGKNGNTALMIAARSNPNPDSIRALLKAGANVTLKNEKGETALDRVKYNKTPAAPVIKDVLKSALGIF